MRRNGAVELRPLFLFLALALLVLLAPQTLALELALALLPLVRLSLCSDVRILAEPPENRRAARGRHGGAAGRIRCYIPLCQDDGRHDQAKQTGEFVHAA